MQELMNLTPLGYGVVGSAYICGVVLMYLVMMRTLKRGKAQD